MNYLWFNDKRRGVNSETEVRVNFLIKQIFIYKISRYFLRIYLELEIY